MKVKLTGEEMEEMKRYMYLEDGRAEAKVNRRDIKCRVLCRNYGRKKQRRQ